MDADASLFGPSRTQRKDSPTVSDLTANDEVVVVKIPASVPSSSYVTATKKNVLDCDITTFSGRLQRSTDPPPPVAKTDGEEGENPPASLSAPVSTSAEDAATGAKKDVSLHPTTRDALQELKTAGRGWLKGRVLVKKTEGSPFSGATFSSRLKSSAFADPTFFPEEENEAEMRMAMQHEAEVERKKEERLSAEGEEASSLPLVQEEAEVVRWAPSSIHGIPTDIPPSDTISKIPLNESSQGGRSGTIIRTSKATKEKRKKEKAFLKAGEAFMEEAGDESEEEAPTRLEEGRDSSKDSSNRTSSDWSTECSTTSRQSSLGTPEEITASSYFSEHFRRGINKIKKVAKSFTQDDHSYSSSTSEMYSSEEEEEEEEEEEDEVEPAFLDEFGFIIDEKAKKEEELYVKNLDGSKVLRAEVKWEKITSNWETVMQKNGAFIKRRCRKGIPSCFRGNVWQALLQSRYQMGKKDSVGVYAALRDKPLTRRRSPPSSPLSPASVSSVRSPGGGDALQGVGGTPPRNKASPPPLSSSTASPFANASGSAVSSMGISTIALSSASPPDSHAEDRKVEHEVDIQIQRDVNRTFPTHVFFRHKDRGGQLFLRHVLHAYAAADPEVGYTQGMGFVVCALSTQLREEETFWALHVLMNDPKWALRELYLPGFPMLHQLFYQLEKLMSHVLPRLARRLQKYHITPSFYATEWFLTLFVGVLPCRSLVRVWDVFFFEGWKMLFRVALALLKAEEASLVKLPEEELLLALKTIQERITRNAEELVEDALNIKFLTKDLLRYKEEFAEMRKKKQEEKWKSKIMLLNEE